jgi:hypothetical protein
VHISDEEPPIEGLIAEGGGDITTVLPFDLTSDSELVVVLTSVTAALASLGIITQRNKPKAYIKTIPQKML